MLRQEEKRRGAEGGGRGESDRYESLEEGGNQKRKVKRKIRSKEAKKEREVKDGGWKKF